MELLVLGADSDFAIGSVSQYVTSFRMVFWSIFQKQFTLQVQENPSLEFLIDKYP